MANMTLRRRTAMRGAGSSVDWESIARGMIDFTTEFTIPLIDGLDFNDKSSVFTSRNNLKACAIPPTMTIIGISCFQNCQGLTEMVIPEGITRIKSTAFGYCSNLTAVTLPSTLTTIDVRAFISCQKLDHIIIPSNVTSMGDACLSYTYRMRYVIMEGSTPPTLGTGVFARADILEAIYVPDASVATYKATNNWSTYASIIKGISERPTT